MATAGPCSRRCEGAARGALAGAVGLRRRRGRHRRHRAGARGYVTKTISGPDLLDAVRRVADGDVVFSPRLAGFVLDAFAAGGAVAPAPEEATDPGLDLLSAREREVMQLLARGYTYREIGSRLFISVKTVESHASNVLRKLQLSNRNELTRWAATNRLL
ncbi:response regulator transcription factor [Blastococcus sp. HT6-30]|uniref:response regulator transcription factor n=1 Tax=Blastococcus sp. HT6-30 TaxID=3144843 RepID=UPI00321A1F32